MAVNMSPLDIKTEDIKQLLADNGINTIDDLVDGMRAVAETEKQSGAVGKITPLASWVLKFFRLD